MESKESLLHMGGRIMASPEHILLLKAEINYTQVFFNDGSILLSSIALGVLEKHLKNFPFFRPNRSVVINLNYMVKFEEASAQVMMANNETLKMLRRRVKHFTQLSNPKTKVLSW